jgi:hypothetical protein
VGRELGVRSGIGRVHFPVVTVGDCKEEAINQEVVVRVQEGCGILMSIAWMSIKQLRHCVSKWDWKKSIQPSSLSTCTQAIVVGCVHTPSTLSLVLVSGPFDCVKH